MKERWELSKTGKTSIKWTIKIVFCMIIIFWFYNCLYVNGIDSYFSFKEYNHKNEAKDYISADGITTIEQNFLQKGNVLSNIFLYFGETNNADIQIYIKDYVGNEIFSKKINVYEYEANAWNSISTDSIKVKRNQYYQLVIRGENLSVLTLQSESSNDNIFSQCSIDGEKSTYTLMAGIQSTYKYLLLGNGMQLVLDIIIASILCFALCIAVFKVQRKDIYCYKNINVNSLLYALYFSMHTVMLFNPLDVIQIEVTKFSRIIGDGIVSGIDISRRISNFFIWFVAFGVTFCLYYILANYIEYKKINKNNQIIFSVLGNIVLIADVLLGMKCFTYFYNQSQDVDFFCYSDYALLLIIFTLIAYIIFDLDRKININDYVAMNISTWMLCLPLSIVITHEWTLGRVYVGMQFGVSVVTLGIIKLMDIFIEKKISLIIEVSTVCLSVIPFWTSFYIELVTLLNQRNIFLIHIRRGYIISIVILLLFMLGVVAIYNKKKWRKLKWKRISYPFIIIGTACLWQQIPISSEYELDIFESANSSVLISDFLNFGDIPIVQHYGGHMMSGVWEGFVYALLNNDYSGAIVSPYAGYVAVVIVVAFFYMLKYIWNEDIALMIVIFFPFYGAIQYWGLGLCILLVTIYLLKNNSYKNAMIFWTICIWCALYRLDMGFAFIVAAILTIVIYSLCVKNIVLLKELIVTLIGWGVAGLSAWLVICIYKGINPVDRLLEFMYINFSNQNWAYKDIGDTSNFAFSYVYILLPIACICILCYILFFKKLKETKKEEKWICLLILGFSYFINFSRGLVRHSLHENIMYVCTWTAYVFIALAVAVIAKKERLFLPILAIFIVLETGFTSGGIFNEASMVNSAVSKIGTYSETWTIDRFQKENLAQGEMVETYWQQLKSKEENIKRVKYTSEFQKEVEKYEIVIDSLLNDGETYCDLVNKSTVYSLINRRNPVYVSQSPLQLSGEYTQERFVEEIADVPVVLMPYGKNYNIDTNLDGVANAYRYYKVFEYIYQHYIPLCRQGDSFTVWCLPERYEQMRDKIEDVMKDYDIYFIDYGYDGPFYDEEEEIYTYFPEVHNYNLNKLPLIWAEYDIQKSSENTVEMTLDKEADGLYHYYVDTDINKQKGSYLKVNLIYNGIDSNGKIGDDDETVVAKITVGNNENGVFKPKYSYNFTVNEGQHDYIFRISNDYYWYLNETNSVMIESEGQLINVKMKILEGD